MILPFLKELQSIKIILASCSPRRKQILESIGISNIIQIAPCFDELLAKQLWFANHNDSSEEQRQQQQQRQEALTSSSSCHHYQLEPDESKRRMMINIEKYVLSLANGKAQSIHDVLKVSVFYYSHASSNKG
jgi:predicted house-cleaning NTP pyrophosphatase (Maf/HAM1 superfamily)